MLKTNTDRKELKTMGNITPFMDHYHRNWLMGDPDPLLWYVMPTKVMSIK